MPSQTYTSALMAIALASIGASPALSQSEFDLDRLQQEGEQARQASSANPAYRSHAVRIGTDPNWQEVERRGVNARRARPNQIIARIEDLAVEERYRLDRQGRAAQRARGTRLPTSPTTARYARTASAAPRFERGSAAARGAQNVAKADLAVEAFGGQSTGVGEYAFDMTVGQAAVLARGGDPIEAAGQATRRFGDNFANGMTGVAETIRDPRRLPGNAARAAVGTARGVGETVLWAGETTARTTRDAARVTYDPRFASKQLKKAAKTAGKAGKSACKVARHALPGLGSALCN
ncbi:hypothetical protein J3454_06645 [Erythrobacter sp. NFXS35]|uniref:hypothetical protein n=1 Tax=Erythrobacter sp. NFXS35 TaxID=2818436 RepID=UPI0032DE7407